MYVSHNIILFDYHFYLCVQDEKKSVKKKRKRKKSSARRASDSSEVDSDGEIKVLLSVFYSHCSGLFFFSIPHYTRTLAVKMCFCYEFISVYYAFIYYVLFSKKKKKRIKEEGDKDKVIYFHYILLIIKNVVAHHSLNWASTVL